MNKIFFIEKPLALKIHAKQVKRFGITHKMFMRLLLNITIP
jgi:hypothetical protein